MAPIETEFGASSLGMSPLRLAADMNIVHAAWEARPFTSSELASFIYNMARGEASRGAESVAIVAPVLQGMDISDFRGGPSDTFRLSLRGLDPSEATVTRLEIDNIDGEPLPENLFIYAVENSILARTPLDGQEDIPGLMAFQRALFHFVESRAQKRSTINFHNYQTGLGPLILEPLIKAKDLKTVFTIHDPSKLVLFPPDQLQYTGLEGSLHSHPSMEFHGRINLEKLGSTMADLTLLRDHEALAALTSPGTEDRHLSDMAEHARWVDSQGKLKSMVTNIPIDHRDGPIWRKITAAMIEIYRSLRPFYSQALSEVLQQEIADKRYSIDHVFINNTVTAEEPERARILEESIRSSDMKAAVKGGDITVIPQGTAIKKPRPGTASSIIAMFLETLSKVDPRQKSCYLLDGGRGTRNIGATLHYGTKAQIKIGVARLIEAVFSQTLPLFSALPNRGLGQSVVSAGDQVCITEKIEVGKDRALAESEFGIHIFGKPIPVESTSPTAIRDKCIGLGSIVADPATGEMVHMIEKPRDVDCGGIAAKIVETHSEAFFQNTFFMTFRDDCRILMANLYGAQSKSDHKDFKGRTLIENGIDFSRHILEPMCVSLDVWMNGKRNKGAMPSVDDLVANEDWETLWVNAQKLKLLSSNFIKKNEAAYNVARSDGQMLSEYDIDIVRHILEPMFLSEEEWMTGERRYGADEKDKSISEKDWKILWSIAQDLRKLAETTVKGGIGVGNIGKKASWFDVGTNPLLLKVFGMYTSADEGLRSVIRRALCRIPKVDANKPELRCTFDPKKMTFPKNKGSYLCVDSLFDNGGVVSEGCVIINTHFKVYVELPRNSVVIDGKIFKVEKQTPGDLAEAGDCIVIGLDNSAETDAPLVFKANTVITSIFLTNGQKINVQHPLEVDPTKDAEGKDFTHKLVLGTESTHTFNGLEPQVSLRRAQEFERDLKKFVESEVLKNDPNNQR